MCNAFSVHFVKKCTFVKLAKRGNAQSFIKSNFKFNGSCLNVNDGRRSIVSMPSSRTFLTIKNSPNASLCKSRLRITNSRRFKSDDSVNSIRFKNKTVLIYVTAAGVLVVGLSYAAVPLYTIFCQTTGRGGLAAAQGSDKVEKMKKGGHPVTVKFHADTSSRLRWMFQPQQNEITLTPGETALAFYTATNPTEKAVDGIATYNIMPYEAGQYFNKIQCFCFEEQRLNPHEQVDMPVFFYIDPDFNEDPRMEYVTEITLSYTFFESKGFNNFPQSITK
ncbi:COX11 (predicted) [Pycnogonum litorale]